MKRGSSFEEITMGLPGAGTKILLFDIETMANLGWIWGKYEQDVIQYEKEWYMLCFAFKWLDEKKITCVSLPDFSGYRCGRGNEKKVIRVLWQLFEQADIIIAHNGAQFDIKKANAKFIEHGMRPPSHYKIIDTKQVAKRYFGFNSNKLDDLANLLGIGRKIDTGGFELWVECHMGKPEAWKKMTTYNKHDVELLEAVYLKLRPWMNPHPHVGLLNDRRGNCPVCGEDTLQKRGFAIRGNLQKAQRWQCVSCGAWTQTTIRK